MDDRAVVARQIGREPRAFLRVVVRCPWGLPAVTEQSPQDEDGNPFPTTYWLTCPTAVKAVARVESDGAIARRSYGLPASITRSHSSMPLLESRR